MEYLKNNFQADEDQINSWCGTWIAAGFDAYEALIKQDPMRSQFSVGDAPTMADCYLIPQIESAKRFKVDMSNWPLLLEIEKNCMQLEAFVKAAPGRQVDGNPPIFSGGQK